MTDKDTTNSSVDFFETITGDFSSSPIGAHLIENSRMDRELENATWPMPKKTRILTLANQKGGVGKTTTTVNIAVSLAKKGAKVLVIDLDPQGNTSTALNTPHKQGDDSIYDSLIEDKPLEDVVKKSDSIENLFVIPATIDLAGADIELVTIPNREFILKNKISELLESNFLDKYYPESAGDNKFDYIFLDCPPSLGLVVLNALVATLDVIIPIQAEYYALEGLSQLMSTINLVNKSLNQELKILGILITMFDVRTSLSKEVYQEVKDNFPELIFETSIPRAVKISEAPSYNMSILEYDPRSVGSIYYKKAAFEIANRVCEQDGAKKETSKKVSGEGAKKAPTTASKKPATKKGSAKTSKGKASSSKKGQTKSASKATKKPQTKSSKKSSSNGDEFDKIQRILGV